MAVLKSLAELAAGKIEGGVGQAVLFGIAPAATIVATVFVTQLARKALQEAVPLNLLSPSPPQGRRWIDGQQEMPQGGEVHV